MALIIQKKLGKCVTVTYPLKNPEAAELNTELGSWAASCIYRNIQEVLFKEC